MDFHGSEKILLGFSWILMISLDFAVNVIRFYMIFYDSAGILYDFY